MAAVISWFCASECSLTNARGTCSSGHDGFRRTSGSARSSRARAASSRRSRYARVGTADLARAAGISEPALYRHFAGKKELFVATIRATGPRLLKIWEEISVDYEDPIETLWAIGVYYYDHLESHSANMKLQFRALSEADDPEIQAALRDNFEAFVEFVADTLEEGQGARRRASATSTTRLIAWQFLGIGMTLDLMHMLGFKDEMDRTRADLWGRVYLETVRRKDGHRPQYVTAEGTPMRAPEGVRSDDEVDVNVRVVEDRPAFAPRRMPGQVSRWTFNDTPAEAAFRTEVRAFIENECPAGIKRRGFRAAFGGGGWDDIHMSREEYFATQRRLGEEARRPRLDRAGVAEGVRRRGHDRDGAVHLQPGDVARPARRAAATSASARAGPARRSSSTAPRSRRSSTCPASCRATRSGARASASPAPAATSRRCRRARSRTATTTSSTARRSGRRGAHVAQYMILLARTDPDAPKHKGISYFIVDMKSPGITVRPLVNMADNHDFNEVFFDNVRVPGEEHDRRGEPRLVRRHDDARLRALRHRDEHLALADGAGPRDVRAREQAARASSPKRQSVKNEIADRDDRGRRRGDAVVPGDLDAEPRPRAEQGVVDREAVLVGAGRADRRHGDARARACTASS